MILDDSFVQLYSRKLLMNESNQKKIYIRFCLFIFENKNEIDDVSTLNKYDEWIDKYGIVNSNGCINDDISIVLTVEDGSFCICQDI